MAAFTRPVANPLRRDLGVRNLTGRPAALGLKPTGITKPAATRPAINAARPTTAPSKCRYFAQFFPANNIPINIPGAKVYMRAVKKAQAPFASKTYGSTAMSKDTAAYKAAREKQEAEAAAYHAVFAPGSQDIGVELSESEKNTALLFKKKGEEATRKVYRYTCPRGLKATDAFAKMKKNAEEVQSVPVPVRVVKKTDAELLQEEIAEKKEMEEMKARREKEIEKEKREEKENAILESTRTMYAVWF